MWLGIDIIGTMLHGEIVIHSAGGKRVARRLGRVASKLGFDYRGETLFRGVLADVLAGPRIDCVRTEGGIECRTHWVSASDGTAVGLVIWLAPPPVAVRPVYNTWMLDLRRLVTFGGGDNLELYGVDRRVGEGKPIRALLQHMTPDDAPAFTRALYAMGAEREGAIADVAWSLRPDDKNWVHWWSASTVLGTPGQRRAVYGLTIQLPHRDVDTRLGTLVRYTGATLLMVDVHTHEVVNASGDLADALITDEQRMASVLGQIDLGRLINAASTNDIVEQAISIEGSLFRAALFPMSAGPVQPGSTIAILLVPASAR